MNITMIFAGYASSRTSAPIRRGPTVRMWEKGNARPPEAACAAYDRLAPPPHAGGARLAHPARPAPEHSAVAGKPGTDGFPKPEHAAPSDRRGGPLPVPAPPYRPPRTGCHPFLVFLRCTLPRPMQWGGTFSSFTQHKEGTMRNHKDMTAKEAVRAAKEESGLTTERPPPQRLDRRHQTVSQRGRRLFPEAGHPPAPVSRLGQHPAAGLGRGPARTGVRGPAGGNAPPSGKRHSGAGGDAFLHTENGDAHLPGGGRNPCGAG